MCICEQKEKNVRDFEDHKHFYLTNDMQLPCPHCGIEVDKINEKISNLEKEKEAQQEPEKAKDFSDYIKDVEKDMKKRGFAYNIINDRDMILSTAQVWMLNDHARQLSTLKQQLNEKGK